MLAVCVAALLIHQRLDLVWVDWGRGHEVGVGIVSDDDDVF